MPAGFPTDARRESEDLEGENDVGVGSTATGLDDEPVIEDGRKRTASASLVQQLAQPRIRRRSARSLQTVEKGRAGTQLSPE